MPKQDYYEKGQLTDLTYLILITLLKPRHGYLIMEEIKILTDGETSVGPGSLYTSLKKLTEAEYIRLVENGEKKKTYWITPTGLEVLQFEIEKRERLAKYGTDAIADYQEENR